MALREKITELTRTYGNRIVKDSSLFKGASFVLCGGMYSPTRDSQNQTADQCGLGDFLTTPVTKTGIAGIAGATYLSVSPFTFAGSAAIDNKAVEGVVELASMPGVMMDTAILSVATIFGIPLIPIIGYATGAGIAYGYELLKRKEEFRQSIQREHSQRRESDEADI